MSYLVDFFGSDDQSALERVNALITRLDQEQGLIKSNYAQRKKNPNTHWMLGQITASYVVNRRAREQAGRIATMLEKAIADAGNARVDHQAVFAAATNELEAYSAGQPEASGCSEEGCSIC